VVDLGQGTNIGILLHPFVHPHPLPLFSLKEEDIKPRKDKEKRKMRDKGQAKASEEKAMEEERLLLPKA
jgi:hypothetical protein